ncbi:MAG: nicotinate (nicotinamide) nucleotide adenylyltransferase [Ignavibacteriae bacterium]|nr:nicotinate (nicotinamide) nucleotide adenylyltransferase [Ignavibacteriota bacterium]
MTNIGIFGGTFDPIHIGHLINAQSILEQRNLDKIVFIPNYISPHKPHYEFSAPEHRYKMTELAIDSIPKFEISDIEITNDNVSYTYNTLKEFSKIYNRIELIIGFDNLVTFDTWENPEGILELAELVVMKRTYDKNIKVPHKFFGDAIFVDTPTIEISGSNIRDRIANNLNIDFLVPRVVKDYIFEKKLYSN